MAPITLDNFLHYPHRRPSTNKEARASGLLSPEDAIQLGFDDAFFKPAPCIPDWPCMGQTQPEEFGDNRHRPQPQTGLHRVQPANTVPMINLVNGTTSKESRHLTTEIWQLSSFPSDMQKLVMGQQVILTHGSKLREGVLKSIFQLEKYWVAIQVSLDGSFDSTQNNTNPVKVIVLLYAPLCVVALPNLEAFIHCITFHFRQSTGKEVDWPTGQQRKSTPPTL
ncbi:hypothetical protein BKA70DRAFT_1234423 [Coprinopsis sp. MPI-PUGE-AT-0042]|nr:hypothetical protein BKA70DRAFT_1234423 [Coprinopsis sp. MPI-PUGE-AT-0042]